MPYTGSDHLTQIDPTHPVGTEAPSILDDALRETRAVFKKVLQNHVTDVGAIRVATWKWMALAAQASIGAPGQWNRLPLATISDPTSVLGAGVYTNSIKPIAGVYMVDFFAHGMSLGAFQSAVREATGNTITPSSANNVADLIGAPAFSNNTASYSYAQSRGFGILVADGIKSYCLDLVNTNGGFIGHSAPAGGAAGCSAGVIFHFLGLLVA